MTRREFIRDLGLGAASLPFILNLPSLGFANQAKRKQRLVVIFSPNGVGGKNSAKSSEPVLTLRGVAQRRRGFIAYIENSASGEYRIVRVGDSIGGKKVTNIELHSVEFIEGKRATKIAVGQTLGSAGSPSALATAQPQLD